MKIVIAGAGSVGTYMSEQLAGEGHDVVLLDNDPSVAPRASSLRGVTFVSGDACDVEVLDASGVSNADVIAAVTGDDEDNLVISLLSKQEFGVPRVVARVNNPKNEWMFNDMWGVDVSVSTPHLLTALVEEAVTVGSFVHLMNLEHGKAALCEVTLAPNSPALDREIRSLEWPREASVVAIMRDGHVLPPNGDFVLRVEDEVLVLARTEAQSDIQRVLVGPTD